MTHVRLRGLRKSYLTRAGRRSVLGGLDLDLPPGSRLALVGPNGGGKSTLLRLALGLETPDSGEVERREDPGDRLAYIPQDYRSALLPWLRLDANLELGAGPGAAARYGELAEAFGLDFELRRFPYQLSGGQQQAFLVARALLREPSLLVLDEPLSAVDYRRRRAIHDRLARWLASSGATLLLATHDFDEAALLADAALVLDGASDAVAARVPLELPWPREASSRRSAAFRAAVESLLAATS